jgi:ATP-binding cassette, subfamily F, member 3
LQKLRNQAKQAESIDAKKKHMQAFVDKFRFNAKRASLVQSRLKAIDRLGEVQMMDRDPEYVFKFPFPDCSIASNVVSFTDVSFHHPGGPELFKQLNFGMDLQSRAAIVGPNGPFPFEYVSCYLPLPSFDCAIHKYAVHAWLSGL